MSELILFIISTLAVFVALMLFPKNVAKQNGATWTIVAVLTIICSWVFFGGIVNLIGDTVEDTKEYGASTVVLTLLSLATLLSANLGVMNLLPIPALDGGRLVFLIIEAIRRKPIDREKEGMIHWV